MTTANVVTAITNAANNGRGGLGSVVLFAMNNAAVNDCVGMTPDISSLSNVIGVSRATNQNRFSSGGFGNCMDLLGPTAGGTLAAVTTDRQGTTGYNNANLWPVCPSTEPTDPPASNRDYTFCFSGTSFATPVVAGEVGLLLSLDNTLTRQQVQRIIQDTADKVEDSVGAYSESTGFSAPAAGAAPTHGFGRVNAFEAVRLIAPRASGGHAGVDLFIRDNRLDWGNTEQLSSYTFDDKNVEDFKELFTDDVTYEACRGGGAVQIFTTKGREPLGSYINGLFIDLNKNGMRTRHIEGNTLLHVRDNDTVDGKTTLLVSIQRDASANIPEFDYTAHLKATFKREGEIWKFSKLTLITDTPEVQERAR